MKRIKRFSIQVLFAAMIITTLLILTGIGSKCFSDHRRGEISVQNGSNRDVYISISGRNQGSLSAGQSNTYDVPFGEHRVTAEWDGGSASKYVSVTRSNPRGEWYISQSDVE